MKGIEGSQQDYGMRIYDPRVGRFLSHDPVSDSFPELSSYQFASNTPIQAIDFDGLESVQYNDDGKKRTGPFIGNDVKNGWYFQPPASSKAYFQYHVDQVLIQASQRLRYKPVPRPESNDVSSKTDIIGLAHLPIQKHLSLMGKERAVLGVSKSLEWVRTYYPKPNQTRLFTGNQYTKTFTYTGIAKTTNVFGGVISSIGFAADVSDRINGATGDAKMAYQTSKFILGFRHPVAAALITLGELDRKSIFGEFNDFLDGLDEQERRRQLEKLRQKKNTVTTIKPARFY